MTKAIAYERASLVASDRRRSSMQDQRLAIIAYAERHGFDLAGFFGDDGADGRTMERPGLQQLLQAITDYDIGVLVVEDVDRLSRNAQHLHGLVTLLRVRHVVVHTVSAGPVSAR